MLLQPLNTIANALLLLAVALPAVLALVPDCKGPDVPEDRGIPVYWLRAGPTNAPHVGKSFYELWDGSNNNHGVHFHAEYDFDSQLLTLSTQTTQNDKFRFYRVRDTKGESRDYVVQDSQSCKISMRGAFQADSHLASISVHTMQFVG